MRELGEKLYQEKVQKEQARLARWRTQVKYTCQSTVASTAVIV